MKSLTLYNALLKCEGNKRRYAENRRSTFGIAVDNDFHALQWQRYDRLWRKLDKRLITILTSYDNFVRHLP